MSEQKNCNHCQFSNEDDLCDKGHPERQPRNARFASQCPDFRGEQKRLDRPDREKIYELLCLMTVPGEASTMSASKYWEEGRYRITDKILALIEPLIEEAKREERERIVDWGFDICILHGNADERIQTGRVLHKGQCYECWQALKSS